MKFKTLTYTTLYPDSTRPIYGVFVENRLRQLVERAEVESRVVAPVPWFFSKSHRFGLYARYPRVPRKETRYDIPIEHPRYPVVPKIGMTLAPFLLAAATKPIIRRIIAEGYDFDILDAHYFYPDGVAAWLIARTLQKPFVVTARGSDLNVISHYRIPRLLIQRTAHEAAALITVSKALKDTLVNLDVKPDRVAVLRNGVDLSLFKPPEERRSLRLSLNISGPTFISVGNLIRSKGHDLVIRAIGHLPGSTLLIAGEGPDRNRLLRLIREMRLDDRVRLLGLTPHEKLPAYYGAADGLILASESEGLANVLLESLACGTPVIAARVSGNPEVVTDSIAGILLQERTPEAISAAMRSLLAAKPDRLAIGSYAKRFCWDETIAGISRLFYSIIQDARKNSKHVSCAAPIA